MYAWRIIGGFDNHSHAPKTNAITKLIVFIVEGGCGKEKSAIMTVLTVQRAQRIMDARQGGGHDCTKGGSKEKRGVWRFDETALGCG